jgi:hypothetical protein
MKTRTVQVVDIDSFNFPENFLSGVLDEVDARKSGSFGIDDGLVKVGNFVSILEDVLESSDALTRDEIYDANKVINEPNNMNQDVMVSLGPSME